MRQGEVDHMERGSQKIIHLKQHIIVHWCILTFSPLVLKGPLAARNSYRVTPKVK